MAHFAGLEFSSAELAALVLAETGGELHFALAGGAVWLNDAPQAAANKNRDRIRAEWRAMHRPEDGHYDNPTLEEVCYLLSTPTRAIYMWINHLLDDGTESRFVVYVAETDWYSIYVVAENGTIILSQADRKSPMTKAEATLEQRAVAYLDDFMWATPNEPVRFTQSEARDWIDGFGQRSSSPGKDAATELLSMDRWLSAEVYAEVQETDRPRRRTADPIRVYGFRSTENGYIYDRGTWSVDIEQRRSDRVFTLSPIDGQTLARRLESERKQLARD